jgi:hypothetical protein
MALEGDFAAPVVTHETRAAAVAHNAARQPGEALMSETGIIYGPGDVPEVIDEPDYERSLEISAEIFGGDKELYRDPEMTQEKWEAAGSYVAIPLPEARVAQNQVQDMIDTSFAAGFFRKLDAMPACCVETLGTATEALAVLERALAEKYLEVLDKAYERALSGRVDAAQELRNIAAEYRNAVKELS